MSSPVEQSPLSARMDKLLAKRKFLIAKRNPSAADKAALEALEVEMKECEEALLQSMPSEWDRKEYRLAMREMELDEQLEALHECGELSEEEMATLKRVEAELKAVRKEMDELEEEDY